MAKKTSNKKSTNKKETGSKKATKPVKRTVSKLRQNKAESNARKKKAEEKEMRKNGVPISKRKTPPTKKTKPPTRKKKYEKPLILVPVTIKDHNDSKGGHPHIILEDIENKHVSVGLTTDNKKGNNSTNRKCQVDPLGRGETSYMRRQATVAPKREYKKNSERIGKMEITDYDQAIIYGEKAKQKYTQKKAQKKGNNVPNTH